MFTRVVGCKGTRKKDLEICNNSPLFNRDSPQYMPPLLQLLAATVTVSAVTTVMMDECILRSIK